MAQARRFAEDTLDGWSRAEVADVVRLVVSELVTNAVLHAASPVTLRLALADRWLYVEVHDDSWVLPSEPDYGAEAATGRGLQLVSLLAESWGAEPRPPAGKVVWCRLAIAAGHGHALAAPAIRDVAPHRPAGGGEPVPGLVVRLRALPLQLYRAVQQHNDALLREAALMAIGDPLAGAASSAALSTHAAVVGGLSAPVDDALVDGQASADVTATLALPAADAVADLRAALNDADNLARRGVLLTPAALPELRDCRDWLLDEITSQQQGHPPEPWPAAPVLDRVGEDLLGEVEHRAILDCLSDAVLIGDEENRVVYANAAVEMLLGWPVRDLVGRRLTTIVPDRLREAHVAGYSRYLVTGESRIMGFPVRVPARHRNGGEVPVELTLHPLGRKGRQMIVGTLRGVGERAAPARHPDIGDAVAALGAAVASLTGEAADLDAARRALLRSVAEGLGWQFAALWDLAGDRLEVTAVWQGDGFAEFADVTLRHRFAPGAGLPGRAWVGREPVWITDVVADANFPRAHTALKNGLRTAFALPLLDTAGSPLAVAEFYTTQMVEPDPDVLAMLATLGTVAGALLDRA